MILVKIFILINLICVTPSYATPQSNQLAIDHASDAVNSVKRPGKLNFPLSGGVTGNNGRNYAGSINAGIGTKVFEKGSHSLGAGVNYGQSFGRTQGQSWKSKPDVGFGVYYRYKFGHGK